MKGNSGDFKLKVKGKTLSELFSRAGKKFSAAQVNLEKLKTRRSLKITVSGESLEELLFNFLSELIFIKDTQGFLGKEFETSVSKTKLWKLKGEIKGEEIKLDPALLKTDVKAATYHQLQVIKNKNGWKASAVLDL